MYKYKNEHNRQEADDWLWDTIPNKYLSSEFVTYLGENWILSQWIPFRNTVYLKGEVELC